MALDTVRRWWNRYGISAVLAVTSLTVVLAVRQTQGAILAETFYLLSAPFPP